MYKPEISNLDMWASLKEMRQSVDHISLTDPISLLGCSSFLLGRHSSKKPKAHSKSDRDEI